MGFRGICHSELSTVCACGTLFHMHGNSQVNELLGSILICRASSEWIAVTGYSPALFLNSSRQRLSTQGIANIIAQFRKDAGIERNITPHMLRHTVATLLLRNGVDIRVVQEFLGHASIATTQRYTHVAKEHLIGVLRRVIRRLGYE